MRFSVDPWDPSYGISNSSDVGDDPAGEVDLSTELPPEEWRPVTPRPAAPPRGGIAFVDGVRRVEARLWVSGAGAAQPGVCASWAAGAVQCVGERAVVPPELVEVGRTLAAPVPGPQLEAVMTRLATYRPVTAKTGAPEHLWLAVQDEMGRAEARVAAAVRETAPDALLVVDGPLGRRDALPDAVGLVKTHHVAYLDGAAAAVLAALAPGQRTPVFSISGSFGRHSWYLRLPGAVSASVPLAGVVRVECPLAVRGDALVALADSVSAVLPRFASSPVKDKRAPQNLTPIAGLERLLRHRLGRSDLLYRDLRVAAANSGA